ncbi:AAEL017099-PA [Aedes aegypti]|uniref:AAEL017099-PA n=1 Tax=Aedes aegypti TaxID=7159 RepID=J9HTX7_AEDAE|nr:AAEL017099-PA [Aedes aegypti]
MGTALRIQKSLLTAWENILPNSQPLGPMTRSSSAKPGATTNDINSFTVPEDNVQLAINQRISFRELEDRTGIPQESVISVILFLIKKSGVFQEDLPNGVKIFVYADDIVIVVSGLIIAATRRKAHADVTRVAKWASSVDYVSFLNYCSLLHPACVRCNERGCVKCAELIQLDTRDCVSDCPGGYVAKWSSTSEFMGRVCYPVGFSGSFLAAVVGIAAGAVLCIVLIIAAMAVIRRKQKRKNEHSTFKSKFSGSATAVNESDASPSLSAKNQRNLLQPESASKQQNHFLGSLISLHEFDERSSCSQADGGNSSNPFGDTFDHVRSYLSTSGINDSSLWLQDEFFKLGFRPQDEITTEL